MNGGKLSTPLMQARLRRGLEQKHLAYLLGYKTTDQVSRYETGSRLPTLENALKLEIILDRSVRNLFEKPYKQTLDEVTDRVNASPVLRSTLPALNKPDFCSFAELLSSPNLLDNDFDR